MAEAPALPLWTDAYLADTGHLTTIEHGAYMLLLMTMWRAGGSLPNNDKLLARYARMTPGQWTRIKPTVMEFFQESSDSITQGRLTDELEYVRRKSKSQSDNARAKYRKNNKTGGPVAKPKDQTAQPKECQPDAPTPTPKDSSLRSESSAKQRAARLPENWWPDTKDWQWAIGEVGEVKARRIAESLIDWTKANAGNQKAVKSDWGATYRNFVRRDMENHGAGHAGNYRKPNSFDAAVAALSSQFAGE